MKYSAFQPLYNSFPFAFLEKWLHVIILSGHKLIYCKFHWNNLIPL